MRSPEPSETDPAWEWLSRTAAGDEAAFAELVVAYQDRLVAVCERLLGNRAEAEEAAQEVFLKTYRKAGRLEPRGKVFTWIYRVAVNHCLNRMRRRRIARFVPLVRRSGSEDGSKNNLDPADLRADPERRLEARDRWLRTRRSIEALPASQRAVLVLARFEGLSYRQIARTLGISESAVESRLFRAMRTLRQAPQERAD